MKSIQEVREAIIQILNERNISANKMLAECGLKPSVITDMKRGRMPSVDKVVIIAQYLGVSVEYLMGVTDDPTMPKKKE